MILPKDAKPTFRKGVLPSAFPLRGICRSWRVIDGNDSTFSPLPQAGFWEIEVLRTVCDVNARYVTYLNM